MKGNICLLSVDLTSFMKYFTERESYLSVEMYFCALGNYMSYSILGYKVTVVVVARLTGSRGSLPHPASRVSDCTSLVQEKSRIQCVL